jgi:hypothetical protein
MTKTEKPKVKKKTSRKPKINKLQAKFLEYFRVVPIQKYAAAHIGRSEDTITDWKAQNSDFSDQIEKAKADFVKDKLGGVKSNEWILERLFKDHFAERKEFEMGASEKLEEALDRIAKILPASK